MFKHFREVMQKQLFVVGLNTKVHNYLILSYDTCRTQISCTVHSAITVPISLQVERATNCQNVHSTSNRVHEFMIFSKPILIPICIKLARAYDGLDSYNFVLAYLLEITHARKNERILHK